VYTTVVDRQTDRQAHYNTSHTSRPGTKVTSTRHAKLSLASIRGCLPAIIGCGKGGNVTSAGITLCDAIRLVSSRSGDRTTAMLRLLYKFQPPLRGQSDAVCHAHRAVHKDGRQVR